MIKRMCLVLFALVVLQCAFTPSSAAQTPPNCMGITTWWFPLQIPFGWFYYSAYPGTYTYLIAAMTAKCSPAPSPCPDCEKAAGIFPPVAGQPISLATGDTFIKQADVGIPGLGGGLSLSRTWNSLWPASLSSFQSGIFGPNWRSTYEERIVMGTDNYIRYVRSNGAFWTFGLGGSSSSWVVAAPANVAATLNTDTSSNPYYTLTFPNGERRRFDGTTGNLIAIIDRNGNTTTVAYDSSGRLSTVTDPASRTLTFTYSSSYPNLVASVSSSVGISLSYSYDGQGRLTQITKPDQTTVSLTYNSQSLITAVTDSNGKVLESHSYDSSGRGLTSSRASGVEALTITYQ